VTIPIPKEETVLEGTAAFVTGGKVLIHVLPPTDNIHRVGLEAWSAERSAWAPRGGSPFGPGFDDPGAKTNEIAVDSLPAGRYRARDSSSGVVTEPIELPASGSAELTIDLSRAGPVTGRVEGPAEGQADPSARDSAAQQRAIVVMEGTGLAPVRGDYPGSPDGGIQVRINSEFKARVPGDRPVTFRVKHPLFSPDPEAGSATVTAPGSTVVLKLVKGAELRFKAGAASMGPRSGVPGRRSRVLFFVEKPSGEPLHSFDLNLDEGVARVGGFKPGKYTLWLDLIESAPLTLVGVELGEGLTDLGELKFPDGATVRIKILTREGQEVPRINVSASALDKPQYFRSAGSRSESEVILKGLGPGKFKIDVRSGDFRTPPTTYEIVSTGSGEIPLTHDAR
jgi:hypothetical protein